MHLLSEIFELDKFAAEGNDGDGWENVPCPATKGAKQMDGRVNGGS